MAGEDQLPTGRGGDARATQDKIEWAGGQGGGALSDDDNMEGYNDPLSKQCGFSNQGVEVGPDQYRSPLSMATSALDKGRLTKQSDQLQSSQGRGGGRGGNDMGRSIAMTSNESANQGNESNGSNSHSFKAGGDHYIGPIKGGDSYTSASGIALGSGEDESEGR